MGMKGNMKVEKFIFALFTEFLNFNANFYKIDFLNKFTKIAK